MRYLVYRSFAVLPLETSADIFSILRQCQDNNPRAGITGYLYYENGKFFQYIEGSDAAVSQLMSRIVNDPRHCAVQVLGSGFRDDRRFPGWDMGFDKAALAEGPLESLDPRVTRSADEVVAFLETLQRA